MPYIYVLERIRRPSDQGAPNEPISTPDKAEADAMIATGMYRLARRDWVSDKETIARAHGPNLPKEHPFAGALADTAMRMNVSEDEALRLLSRNDPRVRALREAADVELASDRDRQRSEAAAVRARNGIVETRVLALAEELARKRHIPSADVLGVLLGGPEGAYRFIEPIRD